MVWYSHLFQNFPQFLVIHTVKGFGIVNKAETFKLLSIIPITRTLQRGALKLNVHMDSGHILRGSEIQLPISLISD